MVLEVTGISQLELVLFFIFSVFLSSQLGPPPAQWKCGNPVALYRISKPGGKGGKLVL
jgi:hypothetical protein